MPSIHFIRWVSNIKDSGYQLYWFDILNRGEIKELNTVTQFSNWRKRKRNTVKGEYTISKKAPSIYNLLEPIFQTTIKEKLSEIIEQVKPDIVHSFEMQHCSWPILDTMRKFSNIPWVYSCWGSDLFFYQNQDHQKKKIRKVLARVDYFHADNHRDYALAKSLGFKGELFGILPGGGGYDIAEMNKLSLPLSERNVILIKGYQHYFGRAIQVLEALTKLKDQIDQYRIIVFGAHDAILKYQDTFENIEIYHRNELNHEELFKMMSRAKIYIGNSISDGIPNTLLEAMIMGVFPIQSNPGGATAEIIEHGVHGFLIEDSLDVSEIKNCISSILTDNQLIKSAQEKNSKYAKDHLDYTLVKNKIESAYLSILKS